MYMYRYEYDTNNHSTVSCGGICGSGQCACTHTHTHTAVAEAMSNEIHCPCLQPSVMVLFTSIKKQFQKIEKKVGMKYQKAYKQE